jgi:hypothetical protein
MTPHRSTPNGKGLPWSVHSPTPCSSKMQRKFTVAKIPKCPPSSEGSMPSTKLGGCPLLHSSRTTRIRTDAAHAASSCSYRSATTSLLACWGCSLPGSYTVAGFCAAAPAGKVKTQLAVASFGLKTLRAPVWRHHPLGCCSSEGLGLMVAWKWVLMGGWEVVSACKQQRYGGTGMSMGVSDGA